MVFASFIPILCITPVVPMVSALHLVISPTKAKQNLKGKPKAKSNKQSTTKQNKKERKRERGGGRRKEGRKESRKKEIPLWKLW